MMNENTKTAESGRVLDRNDFDLIASECFRFSEEALIFVGRVDSYLISGFCDGEAVDVRSVGLYPLENPVARESLTVIMDKILEDFGFHFIVHISEAWTLERNIEEERPSGSLEHIPGRLECVMFNIRSAECQALVVNPLYRDPDRIVRGEVQWEVLEGVMVRDKKKTH